MALSTPTSLNRYRPALYLLVGIAAAFTIVYIHNQHSYSAPDRSLRRRNAVRRRPTRRRGGISMPSGGPMPIPVNPVQALELLERENRSYGTFRIEMDDGRTVECPLIPLQLASIERLRQDVGASMEHAVMMRAIMEEAFLDNFLAVELRSRQHIQHPTQVLASLRAAFLERGLAEQSIDAAFDRFNNNPNFGENLRRRIQSGEGITLSIQGNTISEETPSVPPQDNNTVGTVADDNQSLFSWREGSDDAAPTREGQSLLNLLYHIAEDQARKDGYIHRGVTCNSCGTVPIQGIRYRCANCIDYDLCETCEALQVHIKTHLFYKVRIPAPFLGNPRQSQPVWYPGKPLMMPRNLPRPLAKRLMKETNFENTELDALWDQFRCLASVEWLEDPNNLNMAIDRKTFDRCFVPNTSIRPPPPSLIYDRMFAFYDTNGDDLIGFEEFLKGLASFNNKSMHERLRRIFNGYDIDRDGYVERKDFLRIFRAYYTLSRELTRDMVAGMEDDFLEGSSRDVVLGSQPISAAFPGNIPSGEISRTGEGKRTNLQGDLEIIDNGGILRDDGDDRYDRHVVVGDAAVREEYGRTRPQLVGRLHRPDSPARRLWPRLRPYSQHGDTDSDSDDGTASYSSEFEEWPPADLVTREDIVNALGAYVPLSEVTDSVDRARIGTAVIERQMAEDAERVETVRRDGIQERWRRRAFYTDEEDGSRPPAGYQEGLEEENEEAVEDSGVDETHIPSPRSRSSSKVRFQDDVTDNEYETRSNVSTSSRRSIPVGERWGGFEIPEPERDAGKEILYQVTQQGLNELLDLIFKTKEDLLMEAYRTRADRKRWAKEIENFVKERREEGMWSSPLGPPSTKNAGEESRAPEVENPRDRTLDELLEETGYSVVPETPAFEQAESLLPEDAPTSNDASEYASAYSTVPDPTLPQNRPDDSVSGSHGQRLEPFPEIPPFSYSNWDPVPNQEDELPEESDPTLPQNRPDTADDYLITSDDSLHIHDITNSTIPSNRHSLLGPMPNYESASTSTSSAHPPASSQPISSSQRIRTLPLRLRFENRNLVSSPPSASSSRSSSPSSTSRKKKPVLPSPPRPPSSETLAKWARLNYVEREAKERGGSGAKLNFDEFACLMQGERGKRLAFVGSWIDMTSF